MVGEKTFPAASTVEFALWTPSFRKKRFIRICCLLTVIFIFFGFVCLRTAFHRYIETRRLEVLADYSNQLDHMNGSLQQLETSGHALDKELEIMRQQFTEQLPLPVS